MNQKSNVWAGRLVASLGNTLEWYDFSVYGYFSTLIAAQFFPSNSSSFSMILTFATFAIGFIARPAGAMFFGHLGDKKGRTYTIKLSIYMMVIPTLLMAVLPTYHQVGLLAPILLILIRLLQGFSVGGQYTGTLVYLSEGASQHRAFSSSFAWVFATTGFLLGSLIAFLLINVIPATHHLNWVWRIAYGLSLILFMVVHYFKAHLHETPVFEKQVREDQTTIPFIEVVQEHPKKLLQLFGIIVYAAINYYMVAIFIVTYLHQYGHLSLHTSLIINTVSLCSVCFMVPFFAWVSDNVGRKPVLLAATLCGILLSYPLFNWMLMGDPWLSFASVMLMAVCLSAYCGPASCLYVELFPAHLRYSGSSFGYNLGYAIFGGTTPLVSLLLIKYFNQPNVPSFYLMLSACLSLLTILSLQETYRDKW